MPPGWLKKRGSLRDVENVSTRKLSVRLKSDKARESAADKVKRRASQSTGTSGIRHYGEVELEVEKEILGYFTERAPAKKALEPWRTNLRKPIKLDRARARLRGRRRGGARGSVRRCDDRARRRAASTRSRPAPDTRRTPGQPRWPSAAGSRAASTGRALER